MDRCVSVEFYAYNTNSENFFPSIHNNTSNSKDSAPRNQHDSITAQYSLGFAGRGVGLRVAGVASRGRRWPTELHVRYKGQTPRTVVCFLSFSFFPNCLAVAADSINLEDQRQNPYILRK